MTVDDLINNALKTHGGLLDVSRFYALTGNIHTRELFVLNLQDFFTSNLEHFRNERDTCTILLGGYTSEQAARNTIKKAEEDQFFGEGLVVAREWYMLVGNIRENRLFTQPLKDYYMRCLEQFLYRSHSGDVAIGIFDTR
ncbi:hypothetical protein [Niabella drilacis]|uniref:Uncharacterized protein n=1 Tax=Niabella drilacis (strain DSM 25811 / CCM 8410 / CCUG 62505 / LMG 26954 / E90) TaxID=1285928 RepID=A0A1G6UQ88_NIADE|nr:hypothetical protein [Niabella drilacis]SDD42717.1 hypothetical protein SAMN04487894_10935 [Niabella drilacis]